MGIGEPIVSCPHPASLITTPKISLSRSPACSRRFPSPGSQGLPAERPRFRDRTRRLRPRTSSKAPAPARTSLRPCDPHESRRRSTQPARGRSRLERGPADRSGKSRRNARERAIAVVGSEPARRRCMRYGSVSGPVLRNQADSIAAIGGNGRRTSDLMLGPGSASGQMFSLTISIRSWVCPPRIARAE